MNSVPPRSYARISLEQIARNYQSIRRLVGGSVDVLGVVKAGGYGHGALEVARTLEQAGARWLAVATVLEGVTLRTNGIGCRILVMGGCLPGERQALMEASLTPVAHSLDEVAAFDALGEPLRFHLKVDTGMGRMGCCAPAEEIVRALKALRRARCEGLMTHLASPGDFAGEQTARQMACFQEIRRVLEAAGLSPEFTHAASTSAVAYPRPETWGNLVRAGLALYGYVSPPCGAAPPLSIEVSPALEWKARLLAIKELPEGAFVGYNATYRTPRAMRIGIVCAGYADGVLHSLSNKGHFLAGGKPAAILGSVSMDVTTIDLSHTSRLKTGDEVTLIGREGEVSLDAQQVAQAAGTISYSVLCNISGRVARLYV